jgi:hypothetical protein
VRAEGHIRAGAGGGPEQRLARCGVEHGAPVEDVEERLRPDRPDQEVPGHPDPLQRDPGPPAHLDRHDGQGDRDAEPAPQHVREQGVARVVVVVDVAPEVLLREQPLQQPVE